MKRLIIFLLLMASSVMADELIQTNTTFANGVTVKTESGVHVIAQPGSIWDFSQATVLGTPISTVAWGAITGTTPGVSTFPNDAGYLNNNSVPVKSFNGRTGGITLNFADILGALGYTPYDDSNPRSYINASQAPVQSVAGRQGPVVLTISDITGLDSVLTTNSGAITANATAITNEATRATAAEATLTSGVSSNSTAITNEATRATTSEGTLTTLVNANGTAITNETTRATAAEGTLTSSVASNTSGIASNTTALGQRAVIAASVAALRSLGAQTAGVQVTTAGYSAYGDGGGGLWVYDTTSTATENSGTIVKPTAVSSGSPGRFLRIQQIGNDYDARWFGAVHDGTTDDRNAVKGGLDALMLIGGGVLRCPGPYTYAIGGVASALNLDLYANITIRGDGPQTVLKRIAFPGATAGQTLQMFFTSGTTPRSNLALENMTIDGGSTVLASSSPTITLGPALSRIRFTNITWINQMYAAIAPQGCTDITVENNVFKDGLGSWRAIFMSDGMEGLRVTGSQFLGVYDGITTKDNANYRRFDINSTTFDQMCWWLPSVISGSGGGVSYTASSLTHTGVTFDLDATRQSDVVGVPGQVARVIGSAIVSGSSGSVYTGHHGITDTTKNFNSAGVITGDGIIAGTAFGIVSTVASNTEVMVEKWVLNSDRVTTTAPPANGTAYAIYNPLYAHILSWSGDTITTSTGGWRDMNGATAVPASGSAYEIVTIPNYGGFFTASPNARDIRIINNEFNRINSDAIAANKGKRFAISHNIGRQNHDTTVTMQADDSNVTDNIIMQPGMNGIANEGNHNTISGNTIKKWNWLNATTSGTISAFAAAIQIQTLGLSSYSPTDTTISNNMMDGEGVPTALQAMTIGSSSTGTGVIANAFIRDNLARNNNVTTGVELTGFVGYSISGTRVSGIVLQNNEGPVSNSVSDTKLEHAAIDMPAVTHQVLTAFNGSTGLFTQLQLAAADLSDGANLVNKTTATTYTAGATQTFASSATAAGMSFGGVTADPSGAAERQAWYRTDLHRVRVHDGTTVRSLATTDDIVNASDPYDVMDLKEEFASGSNSTGTIGQLGWGNSGTPTSITVAGHPGVIEQTTTSSSGTLVWIRLDSASASIQGSDSWDVTWIARLNNNDANTTSRIGLETTFSASTSPTDGCYFEKLDADTDWFVVNRASGVQTRTDSGIAVGTGWVKLRTRRISSTNIGYSINGGTETVVTSNSPTGSLNVGAQLVNSAAAAKTVDYDFCRVIVTGLGR